MILSAGSSLRAPCGPIGHVLGQLTAADLGARAALSRRPSEKNTANIVASVPFRICPELLKPSHFNDFQRNSPVFAHRKFSFRNREFFWVIREIRLEWCKERIEHQVTALHAG